MSVERPTNEIPTQPPQSGVEISPTKERSAQEEQIVRERTEAVEKLRLFYEIAREKTEALDLDGYTQRMEKFLVGVESIAGSSSTSNSDDQPVQEWAARIKAEYLAVSNVLEEGLQRPYIQWIENECEDTTSLLWHGAEYFHRKDQIHTLTNALLKQIDSSPLSRQKHAERAGFFTILDRLGRIEAGLRFLRGSTDTRDITPDPEDLIFEFLRKKTQDEYQQHLKRGLVKKLFGKKRTQDSFFEELIEKTAFSPEIKEKLRAANSELGMHNPERDVYTKAWMEPIQSGVQMIRETLAGKKEEDNLTVPTEIQAAQPVEDSEIDRLRTFLTPFNAVMHSGFVRRVVFDENAPPERPGLLGEFDQTEKSIFLLSTQKMSPTQTLDFARTVAHEIGHALQPEETLPLRDAITFEIQLQTNLEVGGYTSTYSLDTYEKKTSKLREEKEKGELHISEESIKKIARNFELLEEWAEMFSFASVLESFPTTVPVREAIVRDTIKQYGLNINEIRRAQIHVVMSYCLNK